MDKILIAASTHWDREWYRTFQEFQIRLCGLMNRLITLLEQDEEFLCYTFDGQSAVLEDYLEIYPENRGRIEKLAAEGHVPDNFGHISQLPQILNGVGIDTAFFFRGMDRTEYKEKEFYWESPDGSRVLCEYMILGYWSLKSWGKMGKSTAEHFYDALSGSRFYCYGERSKRGISGAGHKEWLDCRLCGDGESGCQSV